MNTEIIIAPSPDLQPAPLFRVVHRPRQLFLDRSVIGIR
jgi:hypothetical protein